MPRSSLALGFDEHLRTLAALGIDDPRIERVEPLIYYATRDPRYRRAYYDSAASNVVLLDARDEVCAALNREGIRATLLKGADFADSLYPSPALRPMSDVDLLVRPEEARSAEHVLTRCGFRPFHPEMTPGIARLTKHAQLFVRDGAAVDLHWSLVGHGGDRRAPRLEWFRQHTVRSNDEPFSRLDATAHLLYLTAHMKLQHYDETPPLLWLMDFTLLAETPSIEWGVFFEAAARFGWRDAVGPAFREVETRLGRRLPVDVPASREEDKPAPEPTPGAVVPVPGKGTPERALRELATLGWSGRLALLRGYVFPTPSYIKWRYRPRRGWSWPLYYPVRWCRIARSTVTLSARRLRTG